MAATTVKKTLLRLNLDDGSTASITLPEGINDNLTDENESDLIISAYDKLKLVFANDNDATITGLDAYTISTVTNTVVQNLSF